MEAHDAERPQLLVLDLPVLAAKGALCHECLKSVLKLSKCKGCKRATYCSAQCQKKAWTREHKRVCKVLALIDEHNTEAQVEGKTWKSYKDDKLHRSRLLRSLYQTSYPDRQVHAPRTIEYEPYCTKCYRTPFNLLPSEILQPCEACRLSHHCSSCLHEAASDHEAQCISLYQPLARIEAFAVKHYLDTGEVSPKSPCPALEEYVLLSTLAGWHDYYFSIADKTGFPAHILDKNHQPLRHDMGGDFGRYLILTTNQHTMSMTIIAGLEVVFGEELAKKTALNLHVIGASNREIDSLMLFEEILHRLPALKDLHCTFIGPDIPTKNSSSEKQHMDCCPTCTSQNRTRLTSLHKTLSQSYLSSPSYEKADMAIAIHSGHGQEQREEWKLTLEHLVRDAEHATVFTTWNRAEMIEEMEALKETDAEFIVEGERNKWAGMRKFLEVGEEGEDGVYESCGFWYVVGGKGGR